MSIVGETPQVSWPNFLFSFRGRISRRTYVTRGLLAFSCAMLLFYGSFDLIFAASAADRPEVFAAIFCFAGSVVIVLWMNAALTVKRLHDRDRSGWLVFVLLVPVVGLWITLETFFLRGTQAANSYGTPDIRKPNSRPVAIIIGVAALIALWFAIPGLAKSLVVQSFYIPSAAEEPTLLVGDYIFVSKSA